MIVALEIIELFAGIGSQTQALKNIGVEHDVIAISEIDKYAIASYRALHGEGIKNLGDIREIRKLPKADLWTYSFPCQDISIAGKKNGFERESGTRSGLLWEVERLLKVSEKLKELPKYLLLENVKNLICKKFKANYDEWLAFLNSCGYTNYWKVLNAKNFGIPQNRERVFCVSILGTHNPFDFPDGEELKFKLKDFLDSTVDVKYYIDNSRIKSMLASTYNQRRTNLIKNDVSPALCTRDYKEPKCVFLGELDNEKYSKMIESARRVYSTDGISPTISTCSGGNTEPKIAIEEEFPKKIKFKADNKQGYEEAEEGDSVSFTFLTDKNRRGRVLKQAAHTLTCSDNQGVIEKIDAFSGIRARKLTERECLRLMGWLDAQIDKIVSAKISKTQMYKQAGNGICVDVLEAIFMKLFKDKI